MKKTLCFMLSLLILSTSMLATKTVWNFSDAEFTSLKAPTGNDFHAKRTYVTNDGLTIQGDGQYGWAIMVDDAVAQPEFDGVTYTTSITSVGGVSVAPGHTSLPWRNRYVAIDVAGNSDIEIIARSYNSTPAGKLTITNQEETFVETLGTLSQGTPAKYTYQYVGGPTRLYIYAANWTTGNPGINFYAISATNVVPVEGLKTVWNFSSPEFSSLNVAAVFNNKQTYTTEDYLSVVGNGSYGWTYRAPDNKVASVPYKGTTYTNTLEVSGGVAITSNTRYFKFPVKGNSFIEVGMRSYSGTPMGKVIVTDTENTFIDTLAIHSLQSYATVHSYMYQGDSTTLKIMPIDWSAGNDGVDFYFITATNVGLLGTSDVSEQAYNNKFISYNQVDIINSDNLDLEVFNISGQLLIRSHASAIPVQHLKPGIYIVRDKKYGNTLKMLK
jgi:hypothetical protein